MPYKTKVGYTAETKIDRVPRKPGPQKKEDTVRRSLLYKKIIQRGVANYELIDIIGLIQEDERVRLGQELHDGVGPLLVMANLYLDYMSTEKDPESVCLDQVKKALTVAIENLRHISSRLVVSQKLEGNLVWLIKQLVETTAGVKRFSIRFEHSASYLLGEINNTAKLSLYRVVQEQLTNIIRHSKATAVEIRLFCNRQRLSLEIADNGVGFEISKSGPGIGLINIESRVRQLSGQLNLITEPGMGCKLEVILSVPGLR